MLCILSHFKDIQAQNRQKFQLKTERTGIKYVFLQITEFRIYSYLQINHKFYVFNVLSIFNYFELYLYGGIVEKVTKDMCLSHHYYFSLYYVNYIKRDDCIVTSLSLYDCQAPSTPLLCHNSENFQQSDPKIDLKKFPALFGNTIPNIRANDSPVAKKNAD